MPMCEVSDKQNQGQKSHSVEVYWSRETSEIIIRWSEPQKLDGALDGDYQWVSVDASIILVWQIETRLDQ